MNSIIEIEHLKKSFGDNQVLKDISMTVNKGEVVSIIGASGSGKSTLLRCINLLETPTDGKIMYHGENVLAPDYNLPKYRTHLGMVFQSFNLFNNMNVLQNVQVWSNNCFRSIKKTKPKRLHWKIWKKLVWIVLSKRNQLNFPADKNNV